ncbi:MAG TPA: hypothetical protein PK207_10850 [Candidatus Aminicenantes bacterium]|nr:hypothetical protein [Candidatus Aminicenantes bacterium]HOS12214.1 hypothetical protein [Candidatus Aminicenantes bacterium]HPL14694.1 hypothetical protein [Candidatus Aminicenantes bacterium]
MTPAARRARREKTAGPRRSLGRTPETGFPLKDLIARDVPVKVFRFRPARRGFHKNQPDFKGAETPSLPESAAWVVGSDEAMRF